MSINDNRSCVREFAVFWRNVEIDDTVECTSYVYDGRDFSEINGYLRPLMIFLDRSECEKFCEYLNAKKMVNL